MEKHLSKKALSIVFGGFVALGALTGIACDDNTDTIPVTSGTGGYGGGAGHGGKGGSGGETGFGGSGGEAGGGGSGGHAGGAGHAAAAGKTGGSGY